ncbi:MAG TPA: L-threonylcarbamoyladenylate synthase [Patescibacteria group bacterium]|nr:L-threonylcarbamoyladenylate synthase [Patescibacteria group bacterium]
MLIVRIDPKKPDAASLKKAAGVLKSGGLVVYPTETAYALGCDANNRKAVKRLFSVKKRDATKPLPLIAATSAMAKRFLKLDRYASALARAFWPGPLTLVAAAAARLAPGAASRRGELAVRVSPHPVAAALAKALGRPVVSTSANRSGRKTAYDAPSVLTDLGALPDLVLDAGVLKKAPVSTIVRPSGGVVEILREGPVSEDDLHRALMKSL